MRGTGRNSAYRTSAFEAVCTVTPRLGSSVHLQRHSMPDNMRDLCEQKEEVWARNGQPNFARQSDFHIIAGFFNMPQICATWDRRLYFPSEGRHAEDFVAPKNPTASAGFEPANLGTRGQHANHSFLPHFILPSTCIAWPASQSCYLQIHIQYS
jgi:hypothetical protein